MALVTTACTVVPDAIVVAARVTVREVGGAVLEEPEPEPPHADAPSEAAAMIDRARRMEAP